MVYNESHYLYFKMGSIMEDRRSRLASDRVRVIPARLPCKTYTLGSCTSESCGSEVNDPINTEELTQRNLLVLPCYEYR